MAEYLRFRLYGPLASWGDIAVGEMRHSVVSPSRSALLGLLGAALGIRREDEAAQQALTDGYRFGVKLLAAGTLLRDYHTVGVGVPLRKARFRFRRQELAAEKVDTMLSTREYRCDSLALVAVQAEHTAPYSLIELQQALLNPVFALYLGRKSCPPAAPLAPAVLESASMREALDAPGWLPLLGLHGRKADAWPTGTDRRVFGLRQIRYYWEDGMEAGMAADFEVQRHDQPLSRRRWQFAPRREWVALVEEI
ncbi:MAG: type I-E CRISPR-associated protein Cas5/CasD [Alcaligenaceae bacterium]|nr:type I-E CRISPR-associated protein Cas5/CasD [Alcaligenaceae bacterium]